MLLVRMLPEQIAEHWHVIKFTIENTIPAIPGESSEKMNNFLKEMLLGRMQCWGLVGEDQQQFRAIITTKLVTNDITDVKDLIAYTVYAFVLMTEDDKVAIHTALSAFGKAEKCSRIVLYTCSDSVLQFILEAGYVEQWHYLTLDL